MERICYRRTTKGKDNRNQREVTRARTIIGEALNVLDRTVGSKEEASTVTKEGVVNRMISGSGEIEEGNRGTITGIDISIPKGDGNTSIHSHIMEMFQDSQGKDITMRASKLGPNDPNVFKNFIQNIIVGNLVLPSYFDGMLIKPKIGAAFYNKSSKPLGVLEKEAMGKIIKP